MSIEQSLETIAKATVAIANMMAAQHAADVAAVNAPSPAPVTPPPAEPAPVVPAPVAPSTGDAQPAPPPAPVVPITPAATAPAPVASPVPFTDVNGLTQYVTEKYKALGPEKGALIHGVMTDMGYSNITDVKPEHFESLYQQIEAIV